MDVSLVMFKADGTRRDFPVAKARIVIGRTNTCDLRVPLSSVSREHCEITRDDESVKLRDLGSSNGTYHNNLRVQEAALAAGDEIVIGPVVFTVVVDGQPEKIEPVRTILPQDTDVEMAAMPEEVPAPAPAAAKKAAVESAKKTVSGDAPAKPRNKPKPRTKPAEEPVALEESEDLAMPALEDSGDEAYSPTVDLDDPIAALEAMADSGLELADDELPMLAPDDEENK